MNSVVIKVNISTSENLKGLDLCDLLTLKREKVERGYKISQRPYIVGWFQYDDNHSETRIITNYNVFTMIEKIELNHPHYLKYTTPKGTVIFNLNRDQSLTNLKKAVFTILV